MDEEKQEGAPQEEQASNETQPAEQSEGASEEKSEEQAA